MCLSSKTPKEWHLGYTNLKLMNLPNPLLKERELLPHKTYSSIAHILDKKSLKISQISGPFVRWMVPLEAGIGMGALSLQCCKLHYRFLVIRVGKSGQRRATYPANNRTSCHPELVEGPGTRKCHRK